MGCWELTAFAFGATALGWLIKHSFEQGLCEATHGVEQEIQTQGPAPSRPVSLSFL